MSVHAVIDLETLGTGPGAQILSIGAVCGDPNGNETFGGLYERGFYKHVEISDNSEIDLDTVRWWLRQDRDAIRSAFVASYRHAIPVATEMLKRWLIVNDVRCVWCRGASFDFAILREACRRAGCEYPISYWVERDIRALEYLTGASKDSVASCLPASFLAHHPVDDAARDFLILQEGYCGRNS